jgi:hypothetical protein
MTTETSRTTDEGAIPIKYNLTDYHRTRPYGGNTNLWCPLLIEPTEDAIEVYVLQWDDLVPADIYHGEGRRTVVGDVSGLRRDDLLDWLRGREAEIHDGSLELDNPEGEGPEGVRVRVCGEEALDHLLLIGEEPAKIAGGSDEDTLREWCSDINDWYWPGPWLVDVEEFIECCMSRYRDMPVSSAIVMGPSRRPFGHEHGTARRPPSWDHLGASDPLVADPLSDDPGGARGVSRAGCGDGARDPEAMEAR